MCSEYNIEHRRSVAVLCMLYKTNCTPTHPLRGALPVLYVPALLGYTIGYSFMLIRLSASERGSIAGLFLWVGMVELGQIYLYRYWPGCEA